ncbi:MAG: iron-sulfur cluster-binding domain-containing protein [Gammaproteobacteria bacterium]|nr:iron-sulfur cluster-binding domain-containing protein [Gammaproteobacteria bacterium]MBT8150118.1 iron-sulfur cluster-binding domain-containing protein [Gammaproteobacteria bacterium]NND39641.1 iron-sulfur cluster-binding domain-containing protein [Pseudomonadales bacterium]NNM11881.1 iron-sulfur cluster-binding domain-containing protein [Pseudomonadales bacterium]RZV57776.1 MAG: iron-sulfur cluster-binding domain-containing protein [Pseudomonadales bacterium]
MNILEKSAKTLLSPLLQPSQFDFWAQQFGSSVRWQRCVARVVGARRMCSDTYEIELRPNSQWRGFEPGQHANITAEIKGRRITRSYSLLPVPGKPKRLSIIVRRERGGLMSNWLCDNASAGTLLELAPAFGDMFYSKKAPQHLLLLGAGSGLTPLLSHIRHLQSLKWPLRVTLLQWDRQSGRFIAGDELQAMSDRHNENFRWVPIATGACDVSAPLAGRISAQQLNDVLGHEPVDLAFACGPRKFIHTAQKLMDGRGVSCKTESFEPAKKLSANSNFARSRVKLKKTGRTIEVNNAGSLLEQLEQQGVAAASGCRQGVCNSCSCLKISGATQDSLNGALDSEPHQLVRLCINQPAGDIELDL